MLLNRYTHWSLKKSILKNKVLIVLKELILSLLWPWLTVLILWVRFGLEILILPLLRIWLFWPVLQAVLKMKSHIVFHIFPPFYPILEKNEVLSSSPGCLLHCFLVSDLTGEAFVSIQGLSINFCSVAISGCLNLWLSGLYSL